MILDYSASFLLSLLALSAEPLSVLSISNFANATKGMMTMWGDGNPGPVIGGSCEYAHSTSTQKGSAWLEPFIRPLHYCAVDSNLYQNGKGCGKCYKIVYDGNGGTDPGRPGSDKIQVVDSGSAKEFDCHLTSFQKITGATTGVFPITYSEIPCYPEAKPTVVILDGNNAWYVKVLIAGGPTSVRSATITVGPTTYKFAGNYGATYYTSLSGVINQPVKFKIFFANGTNRTIRGCFQGKWPVATGSQCVEKQTMPVSKPVTSPVTIPRRRP